MITRADQLKTDPSTTITSELVLLVHGGKWHGQTIRLQATRCSIGSGPECTLRLRLPGVAPLICEIIRQGQQATLRNWSPDTKLNGQPVEQAELHQGDRLQIAGLELEIVAGVAAALPWSSGFDLRQELAPTRPAKRTAGRKRRAADTSSRPHETGKAVPKSRDQKVSKSAKNRRTENDTAAWEIGELTAKTTSGKRPKPTATRSQHRTDRTQRQSTPDDNERPVSKQKLQAWREKRKKLLEQTRALRKQQRQFEKQSAKAQQRREQLNERKAKLQLKQTQLQAESQRLDAETNKLRSQQEQVQALLTQQQSRHAQFEQQQLDFIQREAVLRESELRLQNEQQRCQSERAALTLAQQELTQSQAQAQLRAEEAQANLLKSQREWQQTQADANLATQIKQSELQQAQLELTQQTAKLQASHLQLEQQQRDLAGQELTLQQQLAVLTQSRRDFEAQVSDWEASSQAQQMTLSHRASEVELRQQQLAASHAELATAQQRLEREQRDLETTAAQLLIEREQVAAIQNQLQAESARLQNGLQELQQSREQFDEKRTVLEQLLLQERDSLATDRAHYQQISQDFQRERAAWQQHKSQLEHESLLKHQEFEQRARQLEIRGEEIRIANQSLAQHEQQLQTAKDDLQQRRLAAEQAVKALHEQQTSWTQQQKDWEKREAECIAEQRRLDNARTAFQAEREKWEKQQAAWQEERQKLSRERNDIDHERKQLSQERSEWDRIRASQLAQATLMASLPSPEEIQRRETSLNQQAHELTAWRDQLRSQQQEHEQRATQSQAELLAAREEIDQIERERKQLQQLQSNQQAEKDRLAALQLELDELRRLLHGQRSDLEARAQEIVQRESILLPREDELRNFSEGLAQREAQLAMERAAFEMQRVKQHEQARNLAAERADLSRRVLPAAEQTEALQQAYLLLEQERTEFNQSRAEWEARCVQQNHAVATNQSIEAGLAVEQLAKQQQQVQELEAQLAQTQTECQSAQQSLNELTATLDKERAEFHEARVTWESTTAVSSNLIPETALIEWQAERVALETVHSDLLAECEQLRQENCAKQAEYTQTQHIIADLESELAEAREQVALAQKYVEQMTSHEQSESTESTADQSLISDEATDLDAKHSSTSADGEAAEESEEDPIFARLRRLSILKDQPATTGTVSPLSLYRETASESQTAEIDELEAVATNESVDDSDEQDEAADDEPVQSSASTGTVITPHATATKDSHKKNATSEQGDEEVSIDDYMEQLLSRMRGGRAHEEGPTPKPNKSTTKNSSKSTPESTATANLVEEEPKPTKAKREYVHAPAPEKMANLAAMRELANATARSAVNTSRSKQVASQALNKVIIGGGGLAISAIALMMFNEDQTLYRMCGMLGLLGSLGWLGYALFLSRHLLFKEMVLVPPTEAVESSDSCTEQAPEEVVAVEQSN